MVYEKDERTATCKLSKRDINIESMGFCSLEATLGEIKTLRIFSTFESFSHRP